MNFFIYILECKNNKLYTGYTKDIIKRFHQHLSGKGAKFTKINPPIQLLYFEIFDNRKDAMKREHKIKTYSRKRKLELCQKMM